MEKRAKRGIRGAMIKVRAKGREERCQGSREVLSRKSCTQCSPSLTRVRAAFAPVDRKSTFRSRLGTLLMQTLSRGNQFKCADMK